MRETAGGSVRTKADEKRLIRYGLNLVAAVFMFAIAFRNYSIWDDEVFSLNLVDRPIGEMWAPIVKDLVHPPLYYYALKLFLFLFPNDHLNMIAGAKLFSVIWVVILMTAGSWLLERQRGADAALLFTVFLFGHTAIGYSVEIRMYSMAMCLAGLTCLSAMRLEEEAGTKNWLLFSACSLLAAYTNYFALFSVSFFWLRRLVRFRKPEEMRDWLKYAGLTAAGYLPWVITVLSHPSPISDYAAEMTPSRILALFSFPFSCHNLPVSVVLIVCSAAVILGIIRSSRMKEFALFCILNPAGIGLICIVSSILFRKFVIGRYLLPGWGVFWIGMAVGADSLKWKKWILPVFAAIDCLALVFIFQTEQNDRIAMNRLLETFRNEPLPVFADQGAKTILDYVFYHPSYAESIENNPSGRYYAFFWSDEWLLVGDKPMADEFPLSTGSLQVFQDLPVSGEGS